MKKHIFLIGFMGSGKSTVARAMKERYGLHLVEMDEQIEADEGRTIKEIFATEGEPYFRKLETELLEGMADAKRSVVSCGGGVPMRDENIAAMRKSGKVIYLSARPETIYARIKDTHNRPLLEGNMNPEYIGELLSKRMPNYLKAADHIVVTDGRSLVEVCAEIWRLAL